MADVMFRPFTYDTKVGIFTIIAKHCVIGMDAVLCISSLYAIFV